MNSLKAFLVTQYVCVTPAVSKSRLTRALAAEEWPRRPRWGRPEAEKYPPWTRCCRAVGSSRQRSAVREIFYWADEHTTTAVVVRHHLPTKNYSFRRPQKIKKKLECWQLTCQFPTWRSPVLCSFYRDNSMYEQQTWMLTLGLLNRNTGCQCCSVRCSSMLKLLCISIQIPNFSLDFQNFNFSTVRTVKRVELHHYAQFCRNRTNRGRDIAIFRFFKMVAAAILDF